jgi:hypothetical protein
MADKYHGDHAEPWDHKTDPETGDNILVDRHGNEIGCIYEASVWHRIRAESRALAGCPDPEGFMKAVREILPKFCYAAPGDGETKKLKEALDHPDLSWLREALK